MKRGWRSTGAGAGGTAVGVLLFTLAAGAAGCTGARPQPLPPPAADGEFPFTVTFWCGPPYGELTDERAREIAAAGFNVIGAPCEGRFEEALALRALDAAARHGLAVWLRDPRFGEGATRRPGWEERLRAAVAAYRHHPALGAYFVGDEPWGGEIEEAAQILAALRRADPTRFGYVNLLPDYAFDEKDRAAAYADYVREFAQKARPALLSFDYYALGEKKDRSTFFRNLATVREVAMERGVPFLFIGLAMPHGPYRRPTYAELSWQFYHALAYGARGISYFAYWTPVRVEHYEHWKFRYGLIENGRPTETYHHAVRLNRQIRAVAEELEGLRSAGVWDSDGVIAPRPADGLAGAVRGGPVTIGEFAGPGRRAALVVNRDYRYATDVRLGPSTGWTDVWRFDAGTRSWTAAGGVLRIPPGGAVLLCAAAAHGDGRPPTGDRHDGVRVPLGDHRRRW